MAKRKPKVMCGYFALCTNVATQYLRVPFPPGKVPICDRCADKYIVFGGTRSALSKR